MSEHYGFILKAKTRPEKAEAFETLFRSYVEPSRAEAGCVEYHMLRDREDPSLFVFFEIWRSKADFDLHVALPHMQRFHEQRMEFLERDFDVQPIEMLSASSTSR
ncbi:putative quinol monooxygenase [Pseudomonas sp. R5(2019)]|uniref:putative quinol monooxygenase n=1 Tax=Pseudomonas sp. R5(2019) TaxID=2697566 RepID=UPI0014122F94|nr:putative quinol monooxygenase [Pseudomonas sp. R5(2019)]NBA96538.1 antibiotic biosynthesis monooxygenase [Pseudomonas sp. R5(2019)]